MKTVITEQLVFVRSTKNKHLYEAYSGGEASKLGNVYINKEGLPEPAPSQITVTVSVPE